MFNTLKLKLKMLMKGSTRNPQTKFINPYAMSDTTTEQYRVKPEFRDGRFILKDKKEESQMKRDVSDDADVKKDKKDKKEKEPGLSHFIADVVVKDMSAIASISKRKAKSQPIMNPKDQVIQNPPALELELVEPLEQSDLPDPLETLFEPMDEPQRIVKNEPHVPTGNDIALATIKRMLDKGKFKDPKVGAR